MSLSDRVLLTLFTLAMSLISFLFLWMASFRWFVPILWLQDVLLTDNGRWAIGVLASLSLVVSLRFIYFGFHRDRPHQTLIHQTDMGEVRISLGAIENLVTKVARSLRGVRDVRARVYSSGDGLGVRVRSVVSPEVNVPDTARLIQQTVTNYTRNVVGVELTEVKVMVHNITNESKRGRVE